MAMKAQMTPGWDWWSNDRLNHWANLIAKFGPAATCKELPPH